MSVGLVFLVGKITETKVEKNDSFPSLKYYQIKKVRISDAICCGVAHPLNHLRAGKGDLFLRDKDFQDDNDDQSNCQLFLKDDR